MISWCRCGDATFVFTLCLLAPLEVVQDGMRCLVLGQSIADAIAVLHLLIFRSSIQCWGKNYREVPHASYIVIVSVGWCLGNVASSYRYRIIYLMPS